MTKLIPLSQSGKNRGKFFAIVDDEDYERVNSFRWAIKDIKKQYAVRWDNGKMIHMHRFILMAEDDIHIDHIDCCGLNNTRENLRKATPHQNLCNMRISKINTTGFKGVAKHRNNFSARIRSEYQEIYIGTFTTPEAAARAYDRKAIELHGEFARTNFPRSDYEAQA